MEQEFEEFQISELGPEGRGGVKQPVAMELPVTISLDDQELVTLLCSPHHLDWLAAGYLYAEGLIAGRGDIRDIEVDEKQGSVTLHTPGGTGIPAELLAQRVVTSGCGRGVSFRNPNQPAPVKAKSGITLSIARVFSLAVQFQHVSKTYLATHGVHSAAISDGENIIAFGEDIGRHNAVDKVLGKCLLDGISTEDKVLVSSGRVSSEIMHKIARSGVPIVVSISAPTNVGVVLAARYNITLVCSVKGKTRMKVFTNDWRITE